MKNELKIFHRILFLDLRPWSEELILPAAKYQELNSLFEKAYYSFQPSYQVEFPRPLSPLRKYYYSLIENEAIEYLNDFHQEIALCINDFERNYMVHTALKKQLADKLKETGTAIKINTYELDAQSDLADLSTLKFTSDGSYILQLAKYTLIRVYLEIQNTYPDFVEDPLNASELASFFFSDISFPDLFVKPATKIHLSAHENILLPRVTEINFKALTSDFRDTARGILDYKTLIKNPQRFASFEEQLFSYEYIDENYHFRNKHGQKEELAMIYHLLITRNYFNRRRFQPNGSIESRDIRKFLDHRYQASLDKQFRRYNKESVKIQDFVAKHRWLDILPSC